MLPLRRQPVVSRNISRVRTAAQVKIAVDQGYLNSAAAEKNNLATNHYMNVIYE
jgi:hypothetical protein